MSTRATYQFKGEYQPTITVYLHHDGYPEGAAGYLRDAMRTDGRSLAARFVRAQVRAEFAAGHDGHDDTDYRWTIDGDTLTGRHRTRTGWEVVYTGPLLTFVNDHHDGEPVAGYGGAWWTADELAALVEQSIKDAAEAGHNGWSFDFRNRVEQAGKALEALRAGFPGHDKAGTYATHLAQLKALEAMP